MVSSNDCYGFFDMKQLKTLKEYSLVLFGFKPRLLQKKQDNAHSGFSCSKTDVTEVHIKSLSKAMYGLAGMYYFPDKNIIKLLNNIDCSQYPSVDHFAAYLLGLGHKIAYIKLKYYVHLGTPEEYKEYEFWKNFYND